MCAAAAEAHPSRARCMREGYLVPAEAMYPTSEELVEEHVGETDWLLATPPCKWLSTAPKLKKEAAVRRAREAKVRTRGDILTITNAVRKFKPRAVIIEQTSGLRTHHRALYDEMQGALLQLPYTWRHSLVRAEEVGAPHTRARLMWAGVRRAGAWEVEGGIEGSTGCEEGRRC